MTRKEQAFFDRYGVTHQDIIDRLAEAIPALDKAGEAATADNLFETINILRQLWHLGE